MWYSRKDLLKRPENYNFYITTDFSTSEKASADFSVISVWAVNNKGYRYYVDGVCKRQTLDKALQDLFKIGSDLQSSVSRDLKLQDNNKHSLIGYRR